MSEESVPVHLLKVRWQPKPSWASFGNKAYVAVMGTMFLVGVCGIAFVFRIITQNPDEEVLANGTSSSIVAARYLTQPEKATTEPSPPVAADHHLIHPVHVPLWSAEKLPSIAAKHERGSNESKVASRDRNFSGEDVNDVQGIGAIDDSVSMGTGSVREKSNGSIGLNEHGLVFAGDDEEVYYADVATIINASRNDAEETARKRSEATLRHDSSPASSNSSPTMPLSTSSAAASTTTLPIVSPDSSSSSSAIPRSTSSIAASTTTLPTIATTSSTELSTSTAVATSESTQQVLQAATVGPALAAKGKPFGSSAKGGPVAPWLLLCFYDDRSQTRSPGFSVYDFPAQLCTDVVFCCVDVSTKGRLVVSKHLRLFLRVLGQEFLPQRHLFLALGGHRALIHNLDTVLQNPALLATRLSDEVLTLGAGGLAVHFEDLERLTNGIRVHDLIMALRRVRVAVVLPRDVRQQVRYYRTEVYANTRGMLVITPPSQGYDAESRPPFATCPHPRRSVHEGASLEFVYQLSRTLLSPSAGGVADYVFDAGDYGGGRMVAAPHRLLMGVSLVGLKFHLKNGSRHEVGSPATFIRGVPYREICKQPWYKWHDNVSECFVAWDGGRAWMSSLGPHSTGFATEMVRGLAVFDVDFDDYSGECGNKFPVLRALRSALIAPNRAQDA